MLGVSTEEIIRPTSPRAFATELLNGVDKNGNFQSGIAIETAPYLLFNGKNVTLHDYQTSYMTQILTNSQISLATVKGSSDDDKSIRMAAGLKIVPWNKGDSRTYEIEKNGKKVNWLQNCFNEKSEIKDLQKIQKKITQNIPVKLIRLQQEFTICLEEGGTNCQEINNKIEKVKKDDQQGNVAEYQRILAPLAEECRIELRKLV